MGDHSNLTFTTLADLASARVGGRAVATNDDFFAPKANLVKPEPAVFIPGKFTSRGKWMDGWESRRRRTPGHDWCIVQLGMRGIVHGINVDTSHFTGNFPSHCSIEAVDVNAPLRPSAYAAEGPPWTTLLAKSPLRGNGDNFFAIDDRRPWTHVRLSIYPDGGVARLRVYGEVAVDWTQAAPRGSAVDLASIKNGGLFLDASDMHYGTRGSLIMPGRAEEHGRRMGNAPAPRSRARLGDCAPGRAGHRVESRNRHQSLQRQLSRQRVARRCLRRDAPLDALGGAWTSSCRRPSCRPASGISFPASSCSRPARFARAAEHLPGRRRQPLAGSWNAGRSLMQRMD